MLPFRVNLAIQSESHSVPPPSSPRSLRALCVSALDFSSVLPVSRLASHQIPAAPLFSFTYKLPIFYPLCFDIHPCNGGGGTPLPTFQHTNAPLRPGSTSGTIHVFYFHILPHSFARWAQLNSFAINTFHTLSVAMGGTPLERESGDSRSRAGKMSTLLPKIQEGNEIEEHSAKGSQRSEDAEPGEDELGFVLAGRRGGNAENQVHSTKEFGEEGDHGGLDCRRRGAAA
jgi:hypothetical protein